MSKRGSCRQRSRQKTDCLSRPHRRLFLEVLEDRRVLSNPAGLDGEQTLPAPASGCDEAGPVAVAPALPDTAQGVAKAGNGYGTAAGFRHLSARPQGHLPGSSTGKMIDPKLFVPKNLAGRPGETVTVPVKVDITEPAGTSISGFEVVIEYDATKLTYSGSQVGDLFKDTDLAGTATQPIPGKLIYTADAFHGSPVFPFHTVGDLFTLTFTVHAGAAEGPSAINLIPEYGGTKTAMFDNHLNELVLVPSPTSDLNDGIDGLVTVGAAPTTLIVTTWTPTASGLRARFNRELNLNGLNLYDGAAGTLGAADVILTDGTGQTLAGSMVVADNRQAIEFVRTGGVLTAGSYTVVLRSGISAFRDLADGPLDGNQDGTTGDDFTALFTVASNADRVVSIPDIARGAGQSVNIPNTASGLPIRLDNAAGVTSLAVDLVYDENLLKITAATLAAGLPAGWTVVNPPDTGTPGVARIRASGTTPLSGTNIEVVRLTAAVLSDAPYGASQAIRLENVSLNGGAITAVGDVAVHKAAYLGDADDSGVHSSADAFLTVQATLSLASGFAAHAWTDPRIVADADGSGVLSAADAFLIVQEGLGLAEPFVPDNPHISVTPVRGGVDPQFRIDVNLPAGADGLVSVPVKLEIEAAATDVGGVDFDLFFDPSQLRIQLPEGLSAGADTAGWATSAILVAPGQLRVGMVSASGQPLAPGLREIARLQFHVEGGESGRTGWQPVRDGLPTHPTLLPPITDHRLPITAVSDGSEAHPTWLDIEPVDPRAGGYAWTAADGSVLIRPTERALAGARREWVWDDLNPRAELLKSVLTDIAHEIASAWW